MKNIFYGVMLLLGLSIVGCQKEPEPIKVSAVVLNSTSLSLIEGETATLSATVTPSNAENKTVHWSTSNSDIATVSNGTVTAVKSGTATITAISDDGGKTATCQVEVKSKTIAVESISLDKSTAELTEGEELTLIASVKPDNATNNNVRWISSDETVAKVDNGKVIALKVGITDITVTTEDGEKTAVCKITVKEKVYPVESISLNQSTVELKVGEEIMLDAIIKPDNATNKDVEWNSSNESVAIVQEGRITAVNSGTAIITVKTEDGGKTATCNVTVLSDKYPLIKKITSNRGVSVSLYYDQDDRIIRFISEYEGEATINYDNYVEGNGVIIYGGVTLNMVNGLAVSSIYAYRTSKYFYAGNHLIKWEINGENDYWVYNWTGDVMTSSSYYFDDLPHDTHYEYSSVDNPFSDQQFNMTFFLQENFSMNLFYVLGFCGAEPDKLLNKESHSQNTTQYEYYEENGLITKIVANGQSNREVYSIEYY